MQNSVSLPPGLTVDRTERSGFLFKNTRTCGDFDDDDLSGRFIAPLVDGEDLREEEEELV